MDFQLKGIILNYTLKSYKITPIESANELKIMMKFYGGYKYKSPSKRRRDRLRKKRFLAQFRNDPVLEPVPFLGPGQSPHSTFQDVPVPAVLATALIKQTEDAVEVLWGLHHQQNCLAQEIEKADKEWEWSSNWVSDPFGPEGRCRG